MAYTNTIQDHINNFMSSSQMLCLFGELINEDNSTNQYTNIAMQREINFACVYTYFGVNFE